MLEDFIAASIWLRSKYGFREPSIWNGVKMPLSISEYTNDLEQSKAAIVALNDNLENDMFEIILK